ncbi:MAG: hypothetical protein F082_749 [bacterium F082]|nr:MAG: hypothetical protein F082_749 [bacterium F082]KWW30726.1 MAG: hypothetical protein AUK64_618 [bacterium P201]
MKKIATFRLRFFFILRILRILRETIPYSAENLQTRFLSP